MTLFIARGWRELSFPMSFHPALLGLTGAHWLDDPSDVSCKDSTSQYPAVPRCLVTAGLGFGAPSQPLGLGSCHMTVGREACRRSSQGMRSSEGIGRLM